MVLSSIERQIASNLGISEREFEASRERHSGGGSDTLSLNHGAPGEPFETTVFRGVISQDSASGKSTPSRIQRVDTSGLQGADKIVAEAFGISADEYKSQRAKNGSAEEFGSDRSSFNEADHGELASIITDLNRVSRMLAPEEGNQADPHQAISTILDCAERLEDFAVRFSGDEARAEHARRVPAKYTPQNFRRWARANRIAGYSVIIIGACGSVWWLAISSQNEISVRGAYQ
jgi:hypothetical protein